MGIPALVLINTDTDVYIDAKRIISMRATKKDNGKWVIGFRIEVMGLKETFYSHEYKNKKALQVEQKKLVDLLNVCNIKI